MPPQIDFAFGGVFGDVVAMSGDLVFYNTGLKQLKKDAFPKLEALGGSLLIGHNANLAAVDGLQVCNCCQCHASPAMLGTQRPLGRSQCRRQLFFGKVSGL